MIIDDKLRRKVADTLGIKRIPTMKNANLSIKCPFHEDDEPSASINFTKGLLNCFTCGEGWNFQQVMEKLDDRNEEEDSGEGTLEEEENNDENKLGASRFQKLFGRSIISKSKDDVDNSISARLGRILSEGNILSHDDLIGSEVFEPAKYLSARGITNSPIDYFYDEEEFIKGKPNPFYGYLCFVSEDDKRVVGRYVKGKPDKQHPRYRNEKGEKELFYISRSKSSLLWLTEGVIDALTLYQLGIRNIASANSTSGWSQKRSDEIAYSLRGLTVVIIFDSDVQGFLGSRKIAEELKKFDVDHAIIELPKYLGGDDLNKALQDHPDRLKLWLEGIVQRLDPDDRKYTTALFSGAIKPLMNIETGIEKIDKVLDGGLKDGAHFLAGNPGSGKTAVSLGIAIHNIKQHSRRALVNSCEISKRQMWSRVASHKDPKVWSKIEMKPEAILQSTKDWCKELANNLRIVVGWPINRIVQEAENYDLIIIDYIQRTPGIYGGDEAQTKHLINKSVSRLSDLGRDYGKVIIIISSLARSGYNDPDSFAFKESGNMEYIGTTASRLIKTSGEKLIWNLQKNTRGEITGRWGFFPDLGHCLPERK